VLLLCALTANNTDNRVLNVTRRSNAVWVLTPDGPSAITRLGMCSVYVTRIPTGSVREAIGLWRSGILKFLRISSPSAHHHHQDHQNLSTLQVAHIIKVGYLRKCAITIQYRR